MKIDRVQLATDLHDLEWAIERLGYWIVDGNAMSDSDIVARVERLNHLIVKLNYTVNPDVPRPEHFE